jgi:predicted DNA-binding protein
MAINTKRTSLSMTIKNIDNLEYVSRNLGVTRGALINELLDASLDSIRTVLEEVLPEVPKDAVYTPRRTGKEVTAYLRTHLDGLAGSLAELNTDLDSMEGVSNDNPKH